MTQFTALDRPTVFISASRDMHLEASIAVEIVEEFRHSSPAHRHLDSYLWTKSDQVWRGDATWQEMIPSPADPMIVAVICIVGERLGEPLPPYFPLPADCRLPEVVQFPWQGECDGKIPLTGTLFEYLYARARMEQFPLAERPAPLLVYVRANSAKVAAAFSADQRDLGFWRHYEAVSQSRRREDIDEYFRQIEFVSTFLDKVHRSRERGTIFLGQRADDFREKLRADLVEVLDLPISSKKRVHTLKGLLPYDVTDRDIFAGRTRTVDKIFREIQRKEHAETIPTAALIVGTSGAGKSSVLRAGVAAEIRDGIRNSLNLAYRVLVVTPRQLLRGDPVAILGAMLADEGVLPELGRADDLSEALAGHPDTAADKLIGRIVEACAVASENERIRSRFGVARKVQLVIAVDQIEELIGDTTLESPSGAVIATVRFLIDGAKRRAFWVIGSLADARLSHWNRLVTEDSAHFDYWPLGNPDWESLNEIVECSFQRLGLPIDTRLKEELIRSCQGIDRTGTATLPLLSVAMTRLAETIRERCLKVLRQQLADNQPAMDDVAFGDLAKDQLINVQLPEEMVSPLVALADVKSAVDELAEQAWSASMSSVVGPDKSQTLEVGRFLRRLIAISPNAPRDSISLLACAASDPALAKFAQLIDALRNRRILMDIAGDRIQIVHEAVVRHWVRAEQWFKKAQQTLLFLETIRPLARNWSEAAASQKRDMILPAGYWGEAQRVLVDWYGDYDHVPIVFIRASLAGHASQFIHQRNEDGWYPLGVAAHLGDVDLVTAYLAAGAPLDHGGPDGSTPLHYAENVGTASALLSGGSINVNARAIDGTTALHGAVRNGRSAVVEALLDAGADINASDGAGFTALHHAVDTGQIEIAQLLLDRHGEVDVSNAAGETPLTMACARGNSAAAKLLLERGADVHCRDSQQRKPLHHAILGKERGCVEELLQHGAANDRIASAMALRMAAEQGLAEIAQLLISFEAPVDNWDTSGRTPLYQAALSGHGGVAAVLLRAGADVDRIAADGASILHAAATGGSREIVESILTRTNKIDAQDNGGQTALHLASVQKHVPVIKSLLMHGADSAIEDQFGYLPLARAIDNYGSAADSTIVAFLDAGVSPNQANARGETALGLAASMGNIETLKLFLARSGSLAEMPGQSRYLLVKGVLSGNPEAVRLLCEHGTPVDGTDARGMSALMYACWSLQERAVAILLEHGANPRMKGTDAWTPLMFTAVAPAEKEDIAAAITRLLLDAGASAHDRDDHGLNAEEIARTYGAARVNEMLHASRTDRNEQAGTFLSRSGNCAPERTSRRE